MAVAAAATQQRADGSPKPLYSHLAELYQKYFLAAPAHTSSSRWGGDSSTGKHGFTNIAEYATQPSWTAEQNATDENVNPPYADRTSHAARASYQGGGKYLLPIPMMNILNGGRHANNGLDIQEFMIVPQGFATFGERLRAGSEISHTLRNVLQDRGMVTGVGDEGGFAPELASNEEAIQLIGEAVRRTGYEFGTQVGIAIDCASTEFYHAETKRYHFEGSALTAKEMADIFEKWCQKYPILSIEDGCAEDDWEGWKRLTDRFAQVSSTNAAVLSRSFQSSKRPLMLVGDDLFATNIERFQRGVQEGVANTILVKPNQIGTLSETLAVVAMAHRYGYQTIISHRSGETTDTFIADLAVGLSAGWIKTGSPCRGERTAKYNQLLRIEESLSPFPGPESLL
ncbi:MAG: phosphopyruvate hydratase [Thermoguttaceae bacterium]|nr:phosphopyruvate hydratase [Thermoguttaceae bacterium]